MSQLVAQALRKINDLPVLTVLPRLNAGQTEADLLHPDSFVADTQVTLHDLLSDFNTRRHFLGKRIAGMDIGGSYLPFSLNHMREANKICLIHGDDEQGIHNIGLPDSSMAGFLSRNLGFAVVDFAELPPIRALHFVSAIVEDDAAILVPLDDVATVKVIMSFKREVTVEPFTAVIIPPGSPIFMQGARSMLIRPTIV